MSERVLLALIVLSPVLVMSGMWLVHRWFTQPTTKVVKEIIMVVLLFGAIGTWLVSSGLGNKGAYLRFQREEWLLAVVPMFALILFLQYRTFSGISRGRMWLSFLLRTSIMILLLIAL